MVAEAALKAAEEAEASAEQTAAAAQARGLIVRHGASVHEVSTLARRLGVQAVYASHDDEPAALAREAAMVAALLPNLAHSIFGETVQGLADGLQLRDGGLDAALADREVILVPHVFNNGLIEFIPADSHRPG